MLIIFNYTITQIQLKLHNSDRFAKLAIYVYIYISIYIFIMHKVETLIKNVTRCVSGAASQRPPRDDCEWARISYSGLAYHSGRKKDMNGESVGGR